MYDDSPELKALKAKEQELRDELARLQTRRNRVTKPESVRATNAAYNDTWDAIEANAAAQTVQRRKELDAHGLDFLAKRLAGARNYSYEATMSDYSIGSINRAGRDVGDVTEVIKARGVDPNSLVISLPGQGWIVMPTPEGIAEGRAKLDANEHLLPGPRARAYANLEAQAAAIGVTV